MNEWMNEWMIEWISAIQEIHWAQISSIYWSRELMYSVFQSQRRGSIVSILPQPRIKADDIFKKTAKSPHLIPYHDPQLYTSQRKFCDSPSLVKIC